ncbi:T3SS effector HopA1 family protein [uncultured Modestobacter sp.]|uniref:T3SS effector HopA1 family protein n=1 Tax=uncultured Modestobacter sp. TaxID=380048 RepID=UPI00261D27B1|nr:T3SS effector HopA1 family protein [uncultured Modestobacter sp.]
MTSTLGTVLSPALARALDEVHVAPGGRSAVVHGDVIEADSPRALRATLSSTLYRRLHMGQPPAAALGAGADRPRSSRDAPFERALSAAVPHRHTVVRGRVLAEVDGGAVVALPDAVVQVPASALSAPGVPGDVVEVRVPAARPGLSPGFLLVQSTGPARPPGDDGLQRVYVHVPEADRAASVWAEVLSVLAGHGGGHRSKVASSPQAYPRQDAIVVYSGSAAEIAGLLVRRLAGHPGTGASTSPFAEAVGPGVAVASEPADDRAGRRGLSFGEHRCGLVADALVACAMGAGRWDVHGAVAAALVAGRVDPLRPAYNLPPA